MTTTPTAVAALQQVAKVSIQAQTSDPNYGQLYAGLIFQDKFTLDSYDWPVCAIYEANGQAQRQGLGTIKQWRHPTIRCDIMAATADYARQIVEQVRSAWITDFNYTPLNLAGVEGQGYLRVRGGIKDITFGEPRPAPLEKREYFRRQFDIVIEIGD